MTYFITFLEGLISFISPCTLPLLPVYVSYFAGGADKREGIGKVLGMAAGFVAGFTVVFTAMGLFAGTLGSFLTEYSAAVNIVCGVIVALFGLSFLEVIRLPFFRGMKAGGQPGGVFSSFLFGAVYSVNLTPCVGAFLGSAISLAASGGGAAEGTLLLLAYSLGLGVPFMISAVLIDRLNKVFSFIKRHYRVINTVCGVFLIIVGALMSFGIFGQLTLPV